MKSGKEMEAFPGFFSELGWLYSVLQFLMVVAWRLVLGENPAFCGVDAASMQYIFPKKKGAMFFLGNSSQWLTDGG